MFLFAALAIIIGILVLPQAPGLQFTLRLASASVLLLNFYPAYAFTRIY